MARREFSFRIPSTLCLRIEAESEAEARAAAEAWQMHANGWDEFTTDYEPASNMDADELPASVRVVDATVYVESDGEPVLATTSDLPDGCPTCGEPVREIAPATGAPYFECKHGHTSGTTDPTTR